MHCTVVVQFLLNNSWTTYSTAYRVQRHLIINPHAPYRPCLSQTIVAPPEDTFSRLKTDRCHYYGGIEAQSGIADGFIKILVAFSTCVCLAGELKGRCLYLLRSWVILWGALMTSRSQSWQKLFLAHCVYFFTNWRYLSGETKLSYVDKLYVNCHM